jgi:K+-sensing histidine kinase KdpD
MLTDTRCILDRGMKTATPIVISCALVTGITFILWVIKVQTSQPTHLIFFYLLPITVVTFVFGLAVGLMSGVLASLLGFYFLYDPMYSFQFVDCREIGEVAWFLLLVVLGTKCVVEIRRGPKRYR